MAAPFHTAKGLTQSQHAFFLWTLQNQVGKLRPATMVDGQQWEQTYYAGGCMVALSDTERNTSTDRKYLKRHSYGTVTIEFIATDPDQQGQGAASHQLKALGALADRWNISLRLRVLAHESSPLSDEQLTQWYRRYHFTEQDGLYLTRLPKERRQQPVAVPA